MSVFCPLAILRAESLLRPATPTPLPCLQSLLWPACPSRHTLPQGHWLSLPLELSTLIYPGLVHLLPAQDLFEVFPDHSIYNTASLSHHSHILLHSQPASFFMKHLHLLTDFPCNQGRHFCLLCLLMNPLHQEEYLVRSR